MRKERKEESGEGERGGRNGVRGRGRKTAVSEMDKKKEENRHLRTGSYYH